MQGTLPVLSDATRGGLLLGSVVVRFVCDWCGARVAVKPVLVGHSGYLVGQCCGWGCGRKLAADMEAREGAAAAVWAGF